MGQSVNFLAFFRLKLFLPIKEAVAKQRRFKRSRYIDPPLGQQQLGQVWKTEGYFDVVWKNHELNHSWISGKDLLNGIETLIVDVNLVDLIRHIISKILETLNSLYNNN
jgi:hypothetical protein